jgi:hypothetical protein
MAILKRSRAFGPSIISIGFDFMSTTYSWDGVAFKIKTPHLRLQRLKYSGWQLSLAHPRRPNQQ